MNLIVTVEDPTKPICVELVSGLSAEESVLYGGAPDAIATIPKGVDGQGGAFVVAWLEGEGVACGAIRPMNDGVAAEVKRMYVKPSARRRGISRHVLAKLESLAREFGYSILRLETGNLQPEAISLYESSGFERIPCYGQYADDPYSVCFEKQL
jgi:putative acetyltransferase